ncbi:MAG: hypothetical protein ACK4YQ_08540 [Phenylobacterium sp.]|uniref:hypothetical protein n=1 Tax=Phenylobacterium sp. TaxID=1871053 RepID=UPI003918CF5E
MDQRTSPRRRAPAQAAAGAALAVLGSLTLSLLVWMSNSASPAAHKLMFALGLGLTSLVSAAAQALVFYGLWTMWRAFRRER